MTTLQGLPFFLLLLESLMSPLLRLLQQQRAELVFLERHSILILYLLATLDGLSLLYLQASDLPFNFYYKYQKMIIQIFHVTL